MFICSCKNIKSAPENVHDVSTLRSQVRIIITLSSTQTLNHIPVVVSISVALCNKCDADVTHAEATPLNHNTVSLIFFFFFYEQLCPSGEGGVLRGLRACAVCRALCFVFSS